MKSKRHLKILSMIKNEKIGTQQELVARLHESGYDVTQATISRDIKKLGLIKVPDGSGSYRYKFPNKNKNVDAKNWLKKMIQDFVLDMDYSENIIVLKTVNGTAGGLGLAFDNTDFEGIIGSVAGDDTLLLVIKNKENTPKLFNDLQDILA